VSCRKKTLFLTQSVKQVIIFFRNSRKSSLHVFEIFFKSFHRVRVVKVFILTIFVSRNGKCHVSLLSHYDIIHLPHLLFFLFFFSVPTCLSLLFSNCDVGPSYPAVTGLFIAQAEHYTRTFYNSATERRSLSTRAKSKLSSNWNFVAVR